MGAAERVFQYLKGKALEGFEVYEASSEEEPVKFDQGELEALERVRKAGIAVRVIKGGRLGFAAGSDLREPERIAEAAITAAQFGPEVGFKFPSEAPGAQFPEPVDWDPAERVRLGREFIAELSSIVKGLAVSVELEQGSYTVRILNSEGLDASYAKPFYKLAVWASGMSETGYVSDGFIRASVRVPKWEEALEGVKERLRNSQRLAKVERRDIPVVLAPESAWIPLRALDLGLNGRNLYKGTSPLKDKLGERVVGEALSVWEVPDDPELLGARPFDDEGVPAKRRALVEKGVLKGYILDLYSAWKLGLEPTGSAEREGYSSPPYPGVSAFEVMAGEKGISQIFEELGEALVVYGTIGAGQSNLLAGEFSFNIGMGFLVKGGEVVGRVKDTMVSGNVYEAEILAVSREQEVYWTHRLPYIALGGVTVSAKG